MEKLNTFHLKINVLHTEIDLQHFSIINCEMSLLDINFPKHTKECMLISQTIESYFLCDFCVGFIYVLLKIPIKNFIVWDF